MIAGHGGACEHGACTYVHMMDMHGHGGHMGTKHMVVWVYGCMDWVDLGSLFICTGATCQDGTSPS